MYWRVTFFSSACGGIQSGESGVISSPNYPEPYSNQNRCSWVLEAPEGETITVSNMSQLCAQQTVWEVPSEFWGTDLRKFGKSEMWRNEISSHWLYLKEGMKITQQNQIVLSEKQKDPRITWSLNTALNSPLNNDFLCLRNWNNSFY